MKPGKFLITNYSMGRAIAQVSLEGTLEDAKARAERMEAFGLPGTGKGAKGKSRIVGIQRVGD